MFLLRVLDLLALIGVFVQAFVAWVFVALLISMNRRRTLSPALGSFLRAFLALATSLTVMGVRFFRAHDVNELANWDDGRPFAVICYALYMALKCEFGYQLVAGSSRLGGQDLPKWIRVARWPAIVLFASTPLLIPGIEDLLLIQAPLMIAFAIAALRGLNSLREHTFGTRVVRWSLLGLAASWSIHAAAVTADGRWGSQYWLSLNSFIDLGVQLLLGIGLVITVLETAHRRQLTAEHERERLRRAMERDEKLRALGAVVSGVAHELNNPLTVILGYANMLEENAPDDPIAATIAEQAERCRGIVRNLSALASQSVRSYVEVDVGELIDRVRRGLAPELTREGRRVRIHCPTDLRITCDRIGIEQVVENLVVNALHATPAQSVVVVDAHEHRGGVLLRVADQGPGVPPEIRERLFDPFFTTKQPGKGTGLGLAIAHAIVRQHNGTIDVEDTATTSGAVFRVYVPRFELTSDERREIRPIALTTGSLLVVDDDDAVRRVLCELARRRGWSVDTAASVEAALELPLDDFGAILCDLRMPGLGGIGFHDHLETHRPEILDRTVFFTGDLASSDSIEFAQRCRCPLLEKPLDHDKLFATLGATANSR
ncbi:MAG: response regulator [Planctomycetes bacterium]|nr:response regulator [Planctomycetota bacterium]